MKEQETKEIVEDKSLNKIDWYSISMNQKLSEAFIEKFQHKVSWYLISKYQKLSKAFRKKYVNKLMIPSTEDSWLYATKRTKLEALKACGLYQIVDDKYIIAYKSTRLDGYSVFNFQYKYEIGIIYKSNCDYNLNKENSFGLSVWTEEKALKYHPKGKLFKVQIQIKDIGALVYNNNKIRCSSFKILEEIK